MKDKTQKKIFLTLLIACIAVGGIFGFFYRMSPRASIDVKSFQKEVHKKELLAKKVLDDMSLLISRSSADSLAFYPYPDEEFSFFLFFRDRLFFWSDNKLDVSGYSADDFKKKAYLELNNAHAVCVSKEKDDLLLVALINIKQNFPYENEKLQNTFAKGFRLDKRIELKQLADDKGATAIYSVDKHYLFSLVKAPVLIYKHTYLLISSLAYLLAFLLFFHILSRYPLFFGKKKYLNLSEFLILFASVGIFLAILLLCKFPSVLFEIQLFSPFYYSANVLLASVGHLSICTFFIFASLFCFFVFVKTEKNLSAFGQILLQASVPFYFVFFYYVFQSLVFHSSLDLCSLQVHKFSPFALWAHFLLLLWSLGFGLLFIKTRRLLADVSSIKRRLVVDFILLLALALFLSVFFPAYFKIVWLFYLLIIAVYYVSCYVVSKVYRKLSLLLLCFVAAFFTSFNLFTFNINKELNIYKKVAQNFYFDNSVESDEMTEHFLKEFETQLPNDERALTLLANPELQGETKNYLIKRYFRGFWRKYDLQINYARRNSELYREYLKQIDLLGNNISGGSFYAFPNQANSFDYLGVFKITDEGTNSVYCFFELSLRQNYKSYSFPDLLISEKLEENLRKGLFMARYDNDRLGYFSGAFSFPFLSDWIPHFDGDSFVFNYKGYDTYAYRLGEDTLVVVANEQKKDENAFIKFFIFIFFFYLLFSWCFIQLIQFIREPGALRIGLTTRFQYAFITLFIISFFAIFYFSVDFIKIRYEKLQIDNAETKRSYIQRDLQEMYYWNESLSPSNASRLNADLQELSYIYQTDIHVFDNSGQLIGSSQPMIFSRHLISRRISPKPFFSYDANMNQYEQIGGLNYLVSYTDFYNGDYLQIGYIAVPQFFSQENMRAEIENFSTLVLQIYLIIIVFAIIITLLVGRRLSAPLYMLENKLKEMRLGQRNEKIEYKQNDEIGQLVAQYNRTVDELAESASLLAMSERESAWKLMARQIAHEINNPLTPMKLSLQQLQRRKKMDDENFDQYFDDSTSMLIEQINNLSRIAGTFSNFARMPEAKFRSVDITASLLSVVRLFENNTKGVAIEYAATEDDVFVYADSEQLMQVFNNLIKNAIQAIPKEAKGVVQILVEKQDAKVFVRIVDNGIGIAKENWDKMFVPNFTTKAQGLGLGLAISKNIVEEFGGSIRFESEVGRGSCFIVELPMR